ncbi:hypothetical protein GQ53DRAFT_749970 [Thozetella sp. PMI_491]|nr:hypothetical protein GQ53DRAFT_749970 [Thozetella sp. PMI_491]
MATTSERATGDATSTAAAGLPKANRVDKASKGQELQCCTLRVSRFAYAQLVLLTDLPTGLASLDELQVRSYCTAALRQFLGDTGVAIPIDILKVQGSEVWVRVPQPDLSAFAAAITAFGGVSEGEVTYVLQVRACGDWLGSLLGRDEQQKLWSS